MFAIAFILYRITTCFKRIMTNAGAKLQNKYEIFLRSTEKFGADENFRGNLMILNEARYYRYYKPICIPIYHLIYR